MTGVQHRQRRGFTLIELVVVIAISSVLFALMFQWLYTLNSAASSGTNPGGRSGDAELVDAQLTADFAAATPCGQAGPTVAIQPDLLTIHTITTDGVDAQITWQVQPAGNDAELIRTVTTTTGCAAAPPTSGGQVFATRLRPVRTAAVLAGQPGAHAAFTSLPKDPDPTAAWGSCPDTAARCDATQVAVDLMFNPNDTADPPTETLRIHQFPTHSRTIS